MSQLRSVHIQRFKRISDAPFDVKNINVLVGANNAGKSSIIQALHFGVGILQAAFMDGGRLRQGTTSLSPSELIYTPSESVYSLGHAKSLPERAEDAIQIDFTLSSGDQCGINVRRGRARNVVVTVSNPEVAKGLASLDRPFTIFSPGLAGIVRDENFVSNGVLLRTLARGDANLVLRNILWRLSRTGGWDDFLNDLHEVFPTAGLDVRFQEATDEFLEVFVKADAEWVPIELAGTGLLQAIQILSYVHQFKPSLVVLDEPDSHLHPNNQRLLCGLLRSIAEERGTQVTLTTHSRHVVDSLAQSSNFLWVRNATVDVASEDDEIGILLDIGALDIKERVAVPGMKAVVLTEDEATRRLEVVLESSGFRMDQTTVQPYFGATQIKNLRPLVQTIQRTNPDATIVIHRDRDFLTDNQVEAWAKQVRQLGVEPFVTSGVDIESHFLCPAHLAEINQCEVTEIESLIEQVTQERHDVLIEAIVNGQVDVARKSGSLHEFNAGVAP